MRISTLKICLLIAIIAIVVAPAKAQVSLSTAVSITEMTPQSGVFNRIDMLRNGRIIGSWFSTAGILPCIVKAEGLSYNAYIDLPGVSKIEKVTMTIDGGETTWPATMVKGKGWRVPLVMGTKTVTNRVVKDEKVRHGKTERTIKEEECTVIGLEPGSYALTSDVVSKDKKNRLILGFIPINYSSKRTSSAANNLMVQSQGVDIGCLNDMALSIWLAEHGFKSATDSLSPAVMAAQQMGGSPPPPPPTPKHPTTELKTPCESENEVVGEVTRLEEPRQAEKIRVDLKIYYKDKEISCESSMVDKAWYDNLVQTTKHGQNQAVEFRRDGKFLAAAEVKAKDGEVCFSVYRGKCPEDGDKIWFVEEAK